MDSSVANTLAAPPGADADRTNYSRFMEMLDPAADAVAAAFAELPAGRGRRMLETALDSGIDAVEDAPPALIALFEQLDRPPFWVDWDRLDRGGAVFMRSGLLGIGALNVSVLPYMYSSPSGNKPLVFTGHLVERAPRRLAETARFVLKTCDPGGLRRGSEGFKITVRVRLMHAQVRRLLLRSGRWNPAWGGPVNQMYMAGTNIAMSVLLIEGLRRFGFRIGRDEAESLLHLWRYSGYIMGVAPELLCSTEAEGKQIVNLLTSLEGPPDEDSRALLTAVMSASYLPRLDKIPFRVPATYGISRAVIGDELADAMGYPPRAHWGLILHALRPVVGAVQIAQRSLPGGREWAARAGTRRWETIIDMIMAGARGEFTAPTRLGTQAG